MYVSAVIAAFFATALASKSYIGVDRSSLLIKEAAGKSYRNFNRQTKPLERILQRYGGSACIKALAFSLEPKLVDRSDNGWNWSTQNW